MRNQIFLQKKLKNFHTLLNIRQSDSMRKYIRLFDFNTTKILYFNF